MAITRFSQTETTDMTNFHAFLQANKGGTFLENMTITFDSNNASTITIASTTASVYLNASIGLSSNTYMRYTNSSSAWERQTATSSYAKALFTSAILCSNGLMIDVHYGINSGNERTLPLIAITVDNNGDIALCYDSTTISSTSKIEFWRALAADSSNTGQIDLVPLNSANLTSLAPAVTQGLSADSHLPYAYYAVATQTGYMDYSLVSVAMGGKQYISNGVVYIED